MLYIISCHCCWILPVFFLSVFWFGCCLFPSFGCCLKDKWLTVLSVKNAFVLVCQCFSLTNIYFSIFLFFFYSFSFHYKTKNSSHELFTLSFCRCWLAGWWQQQQQQQYFSFLKLFAWLHVNADTEIEDEKQTSHILVDWLTFWVHNMCEFLGLFSFFFYFI